MILIKKYYAFFIGLVVFFVYLFTIAPSVIQIDSGELAAVQATLGIAHPTGYPLFTILGYLFLQIPLPFSKIYQANFLATIWCSLGVIFFVKAASLVFENLDILTTTKKSTTAHKKKKRKKEEIVIEKPKIIADEWGKILCTAAGGLIVAFSTTYWFQSTSVEVYSLHLFLINLLIFLILRAFYSKVDRQENQSLKLWLFVALVLALGFSNHMTTLLILPGLAFLFFIKEKPIQSLSTKIMWMLLVFFPVLVLLYSYLPIRSAQNPTLNWGNPVNWEAFLRHFTGKQYQVWLFSSADSAREQMNYFIGGLPGEFAVIGLIVALIGIFVVYKIARKFFYFLVISFLVTVFYSINYDIADIDSYFLLAYISLGFFAVFGLAKIGHLILNKTNKKELVIAAVTLLIFVQIGFNFGKVDQSDVTIFDDYAKSLLQSTEKNSIVFSYQWDHFISASYYFQFVEDFRKDIVIVDKELLRRSWYYNQHKKNYPEAFENLGEEIKQFLEAVKPFERGEGFNPDLLETYYQNIMKKLIVENINERSYYIGPEIVGSEMRRGEYSLPPGYKLVPHLFLYKVTKGDAYIPAPNPDFKIRYPKKKTDYVKFIELMITRILTNRALYELDFGKTERAKLYADKLRNDFPEFQMHSRLKSLL